MRDRLFFQKILLFCLLPLIVSATNDDISVEAHLSKTTIYLGEEVEYELNIKWKGNHADYELLPLDTVGAVGLIIIASESLSSSQISQDGYISNKIIYRMRGEKEGKAKVGGIEIKLLRKADGEIISRQLLAMEIDVLPATKKFPEMHLNPRHVLGISLIFISILSLATAIFLHVKNKKRPKEQATGTGTRANHHEELERNIKNFAPLLYAGDYKNYLIEVEKALIRWLEKINDKPIKNLSPAFIDEMKKQELLSPSCHKLLEEFCQKCEAVKFGGEKLLREDIDNLTSSILNTLKLEHTQIGNSQK